MSSFSTLSKEVCLRKAQEWFRLAGIDPTKTSGGKKKKKKLKLDLLYAEEQISKVKHKQFCVLMGLLFEALAKRDLTLLSHVLIEAKNREFYEIPKFLDYLCGRAMSFSRPHTVIYNGNLYRVTDNKVIKIGSVNDPELRNKNYVGHPHDKLGLSDKVFWRQVKEILLDTRPEDDGRGELPFLTDLIWTVDENGEVQGISVITSADDVDGDPLQPLM